MHGHVEPLEREARKHQHQEGREELDGDGGRGRDAAQGPVAGHGARRPELPGRAGHEERALVELLLERAAVAPARAAHLELGQGRPEVEAQHDGPRAEEAQRALTLRPQRLQREHVQHEDAVLSARLVRLEVCDIHVGGARGQRARRLRMREEE